MGTIKNGVNGPFRGKAGSIIGSGWKKIDYIKGRPRQYKNKDKPSESQLLQHKKFTLLNQFFSVIAAELDIGFNGLLSRSTARNAAFRYNYDHAFVLDENGEMALNYSALQFSRGALFPAGAETATIVDGQICITWNTKTYGLSGALDDELIILAYSQNKQIFFTPDRIPLRYQGKVCFDFEAIEGEVIHIWIFYSDNQRKKVSPTIYLSLMND